jgi:hypothetical protein
MWSRFALAYNAGGFGGLNNIIRISAHCSRYNDKLSHIKASLTEFEFRDERLALPEPFAKLYLRYARTLSSLHKPLDYPLVEIRTK